MDSWPYHAYTSSSEYKGKEKHATYDYPTLQQGMVGAVTLAEKNSRLEWSFLQTHSDRDSTRRWRFGKLFKVFPETRPPLPPKTPFGSRLSARHGANFIRTCMPDADIPAELIREQLQEEVVRLGRSKKLDPYVGNLLVSGVQQQTSDAAAGFIAFPMGEVLSDLNVSELDITKQRGMSLKPVGTYKRAFPTPIQQIRTAPIAQDYYALAVRTYGSTDFLRLNKEDPQSPWAAESIGQLTPAETNRREVVDIKLRSEQAIFVDEHGSLYTSRPFSSQSQVTQISDPPDAERIDPYFWRLAFDLDSNIGYVISSDSLSMFDIRANSPTRKCFELKAKGEFLTSIEDCEPDGIVRLCSTSQIFWFDRRNMRSPLLAIRHYRQFDRCLSTKTMGGTCTFLTSRRNNMVSIYDVSNSGDQLLHIQGEPLGILPAFAYPEGIGQTFVSSPFLPKTSHAVLFKLSKRGSVAGCSMFANDGGKNLQVVAKHTASLQAMESRSWKSSEILFEQEHVVINLSSTYDSLLRKQIENIEKREDGEAPMVDNVVENIPYYFQYADVPSEQMLTTYDVAFRAGKEPKDASRSDFLTGSVMNSQRGYRAMQQGRLDPKSLATKAPWNMDLSSTLERLGLTEGVVDCGAESFRKYALKDEEKRTAESVRRHQEQLALDLWLSHRVFSTQTFGNRAETDQTLETMTEALSLGGGPPEVDFGFLRPVKQHKKGGEEDDELAIGMGVKLLLKDWEIGADATGFSYQDPYETSESGPMRAHQAAVSDPTPAAAPPQLLTQRPAASGVPGTQTGPRDGLATKKKGEKKKRMGGF